MAEQYALQFVLPHNLKKRHVFKISMCDLAKSYRDIAELIDIEATPECFKSWLENQNDGAWFLLVDGLNSHQDAKELREVLPPPERFCGQMLITTQNRGIMASPDPSKRWAYIEVNPLEIGDSLRVFNDHIDRDLIRQDARRAEYDSATQADPDTRKLLTTLWSPLLIKRAAFYMNEKRITVVQMNNLLDSVGLTQVKGLFPDYLQYILSSLSPTLPDTASWPREINLLFSLAFFDTKGVDQNILEWAYEDEEREQLMNISSNLQNRSLIERKDRDGSTVYIIKGNIQTAVLEWVKSFEGDYGGQNGILQRYNIPLSTMKRYYEECEKKSGQSFQPHKKKLELLPHFERFLAFAKETKRTQLAQVLNEEAVLIIIYFSYVLLDIDRHNDALDVLQYAHKHFDVDHKKGEVVDQRLVPKELEFRLRRQMVKARMSRPEDHSSSYHWKAAQELLEILKTEVEAMNHEQAERDGYIIA
jgi:hypothetical protein